MTITTPTHPDTIGARCQAATARLRWEYNLHYRRHNRTNTSSSRYADQIADQLACAHLRHTLPIVLAHHLPGIQLDEWMDQHPTVIDSTWTHPNGHTIDVYWDYHPNWTIGDATALTIWHQPHHPNTDLDTVGVGR